MTHSAGHRGYKASAAAASKDNELYGAYSQDKEGWPARNGISTRNGSPRQSTDRESRASSMALSILTLPISFKRVFCLMLSTIAKPSFRRSVGTLFVLRSKTSKVVPERRNWLVNNSAEKIHRRSIPTAV